MAVLTSVQATFDTTDCDKDYDTILNVSLLAGRGVLIASKHGITGHYDNNSTHTVSLDIKNAIDRTQVPTATVQLEIYVLPSSPEQWDFNYHVVLGWSDGSEDRGDWNGKVLTEGNSTTSDSFNLP